MAMGKISVFLLSVLVLLCAGCANKAPAIRNSASGPVRGFVEKGIEVYRGIPYAEPPVGENRWRSPAPVKPWKDTLLCTEYQSSCPQPSVSELEGGGDAGRTSEDCLYLNIWSPVKRPAQGLPVMVWIHGGAFALGSGSMAGYSGLNLAEKGVVVVTINYRLGPFGFLAHPALNRESRSGVSGNYGLQDQIEALRWIQKNIAVFGGDPLKVTVFGESAGALSVGYLLLAPDARGLFHRAIMQSGSPLSQAYVMPGANGTFAQALDTGKKLSRNLGCDGEGDEAAAMRRKTTEEVMAAADTNLNFIFKSEDGLLFAPVFDGVFLPVRPEDALREGRLHKVPVIVGTNRDEASVFIEDLTPSVYREWITKMFGTRSKDIFALTEGKYESDEKAAYGKFLTVLWFTEPARAMARSMARTGAKTYLYSFTRVPDNSLVSELGAFHGQEIEFVFGNLGTILATRKDGVLSGKMMDYWVTFAATGDPNGPGSFNWPPYDEETDRNIEFGDTLGVGVGLDKFMCDLVEKVRWGR